MQPRRRDWIFSPPLKTVHLAQSTVRKMTTAIRLPPLVLAWVVPGWIILSLAAMAYVILPFGRLTWLAGRNIGAVAYAPLADAPSELRAAQIRQAIDLVSRYAVLRHDCVPQALLGVLMCRVHRVPTALHFGLRRAEQFAAPDKPMIAHAWLVSGRVAITGGPSFAHHVGLACLVSTGALPPDLSRAAV